MGLLRLAVFGPPEVFHDERRLSFALRKAEALLLYLAVEGGMHSRRKLTALLWPDSEPSIARNALRNALALLRSQLGDPSVTGHNHLIQEPDLLGLNQQAPLERDLDVVLSAWKAAQGLSATISEEQRAALIASVQHALSQVRGPFLDGFWLREETAFDEWHEQQQQQWQVRINFLLERLSAWQEESFELEAAKATLTQWLVLDPLAEEASRRLMRLHLAQGNLAAAGRVYTTLRARLAEELHIKPSAETVALAERLRIIQARPGAAPAHPSPTKANQPPGELEAPFVGRTAAFRQLMGRYQQAKQGQPQAVLLVGEAGIGKTRLASELVAWAWAQGAEVLQGRAFESGGRLPYQPLVEALRKRLEAENAPEDLLEDLWLAELSRLLPELRLRYPDLPISTQDELSGKLRLFEAVARLFEALAQRAPVVVLLINDLHWIDGASLDLLRYLGHAWKGQGSRVLLLGTVRSEELELNRELAAQLLDLGRDLPLTQLSLEPLDQSETLALLEALAGDNQHDTAQPSMPESGLVAEQKSGLVALGDFLFAQTGGQPLYLLETLKLLRERQWLLLRLNTEGVFRLTLTRELMAALTRKESRRELLPPSVRVMLQTRLARLSVSARQLVMACAVLGSPASAKLLWRITELGVPEGLDALEEAVKSGILHEEDAGAGRPASYRFTHDLVRDVVYTELGAARRLILHQRALAVLESEGARASELAYHALAGLESERAYRYSVQAGDEAEVVFAVAEAVGHYEQARTLLHEQPQLPRVLTASEVEHLYVRLGQAYGFQNAWTKTQEMYEELLAYAQEHHLAALVSMTLNRLAIWAIQQAKDRPQVQALLEEAWHSAEISSDQRILAETAWNQAQITGFVWQEPKRALDIGEQALKLARTIADKELEARSQASFGALHLLGGDFEEAIHLLEAALGLYAALDQAPLASPKLSLPSIATGAPLTQPLSNRASEAVTWGVLALAQVNAGQVQPGIASGRRGLALSAEIKNVWTQVLNTVFLTFGLVEAGAYAEVSRLVQEVVAAGPILALIPVVLQGLLTAQGRAYQAMQQWQEAYRIFEETIGVAKGEYVTHFRVSALSRLCLHWAVAGEWEVAAGYALQAIAERKRIEAALIWLDFSSHFETEALLHIGQERLAREAVQQLGEGLGSSRRFRIPYLRSLAVLAEWEGHGAQAIASLCEAAELAAGLGLPEEQWQIQARLAGVYEASGEPAQARLAWAKASAIIVGLAQDIQDKALRARFLAGPQIQPVLLHTQPENSSVTPSDRLNQL